MTAVTSGWTFLGAPADSVLRGGGAELAPARLRKLALPDRLGARDLGDLPVRVRGDDRDPETGIVGSEHVLANASVVGDAVRERVTLGERVVLAGGCCANVPGALAGARDAADRIGLVYVDGHQDIWDGTTSMTGEAADMPFGVAIGVGPATWVAAIGGAPVAPSDAVLVGFRDQEETVEAGLPDPSELGVAAYPIERVRKLGPERTAADALEHLANAGVERWWLHLDVDVLDMDVFPATDYLDPNGMTWEELTSVLRPLGRAAGLVGLSTGCFNPEKDPDGSSGKRLADTIVDVLAPAAG